MAAAVAALPPLRAVPKRHCCLLPSSRRRYPSNVTFTSSDLLPSSRTQHIQLGHELTCRVAATSLPILERKAEPNTEIRRLCEMGNLEEALEIISQSQLTQRPHLDSDSYCSVLQLCAELRALPEGRMVHSFISSSDARIDERLGLKLVFMYVKCGDLREGRQVFDGIEYKDSPLLWNLLLNEYAKVGEFKEAIFLFERMRGSNVKLNAYVFSCILKCAAALGSVESGEKVHGLIMKSGFGDCVAVGNALIALYCKCGRLDSALKLFEEMPDKDVITWNSIINGCVANGFHSKGIEIFWKMWLSGIHMDLTTLVTVLPACAEVHVLAQGRAIHGHSLKSGYEEEIILNNSLMDMYCKCGDLGSAIQVFERMKHRTVVSWTSMILGYTRAAQSEEAINLFGRMESAGVKPDQFVITSVLHACASCGSLQQGKSIHDYLIREQMGIDLFVANSLMDMYVKCGSMEDARNIFDGMDDKDIISWNTMIGGYSRNHLANEALSLFRQMLCHMKPNSITISCIISAVSSLLSLDRGKEIHGHILRTHAFSNGHITNALVDMYAKCGELSLARNIFDRIIVKDPISWTIMIAGCCLHGNGKEAISIFKKMRRAKFELSEISFIAILYACSHSGLVDEGWIFFDIMRNESRIEPKLEHYTCMVDLLSRAGRLTKAYKFIQSMPVEPDSRVWGALLCGCRIHRDAKLAEVVAEHIFALEPDNKKYYIILANIYAETEKWEVKTENGQDHAKESRMQLDRNSWQTSHFCCRRYIPPTSKQDRLLVKDCDKEDGGR